MSEAISSSLNHSELQALSNLNKQQEAYLRAVEKGVITATSVQLKRIDKEREEILKPSNINSKQVWPVALSILTELVIIACFSTASSFSTHRKDEILVGEKEVDTVLMLNEDDASISRDVPGVRELMRLHGIGYPKAKALQSKYITNPA